jgi:hypothetical protein
MVNRIKDNLPPDKPFLLLEGKSIDFIIATGADKRYLHICPRCGIPVTNTTRVIYVAVEDTIMCGKCAERWLNYSRWYSEDIQKEKDNYEAMVQKLKDSKLWKE